MSCRSIVPLLLASLIVGAPTVEAASIAVVSLDAEGVSWEMARSATEQLAGAIGRLEGHRAITRAMVKADAGIDLDEHARGCKRELFCLVQLGEAVGAERMVLGSLSRKGDHDILQLLAIDVPKAAMLDTLRWKIPARTGALEDALPTAARHLFSFPDARLILDITPKDAKLLLYGEPSDQPFGKDVPFWSGVYYADVSRAGHEPQQVRIMVPRGGPTRVEITLEADPLWIDPHASKRRARAPRGGRAPDAITEREDPPRVEPPGPSPFANWIAWGIVGVGLGGATAGTLIMSSAQSDYNTLSGELRYTDDSTRTALEAGALRTDARDRFRTGSQVLIGGIAVAAGGVAWMVIDAIVSGGSKDPVAAIRMGSAGGVACALSF